MKRGFTLIELMIVIAIIAIIAAIAIPGILRARIAANERNASTSLKVILTAEENFKGADVDRNNLPDYWTIDVSGLYCITVQATMRPIGCVSDTPMCQADVLRLSDSGLTFQGQDDDGDGTADTVYDSSVLGTTRSPKSGYWYLALLQDDAGVAYAQNTDGQGPFHNNAEFGYCALPALWDSTGNYAFMITNLGSVMRRDFGTGTTVAAAGTPVADFAPGFPLDSPNAAAMSTWGKVE